MMKTVIGIDRTDQFKNVSGLISALNFANLDCDLVHVLERLGDRNFLSPEGSDVDLAERYMLMQEKEAEGLLNQGSKELSGLGIECTKKMLLGFSANQLIDYVKKVGADLLALGSSEKSPIERLILGSVARKAIITSPSSILIGKNFIAPRAPITAIFATDHSDYARQSFEKFLSWGPGGIAKIVIATIFPKQLVDASSAMMPHFKAEVSPWVIKELKSQNDSYIKLLSDRSIQGKSRVEEGSVSESLARIFHEENADIMIMGAQGHGFIDRLTLGSVSLDQSMHHPYSILIIRL